jgi:translation initiation factor IF-3
MAKKIEYRINNNIKANTVRVVGDFENSGEIYTIREALRIADEIGLDLVEISPNANPPVVRIIDYNKFIYEIKKKQKEQEKKQKENSQEVKELKFGPNIDEHDYNFKLKHAQSFLERGDIVKATILFKGREIQFKEKGEIILLNLANDLSEYGTPDNAKPRLEGKRMIMTIKPKKKN